MKPSSPYQPNSRWLQDCDQRASHWSSQRYSQKSPVNKVLGVNPPEFNKEENHSKERLAVAVRSGYSKLLNSCNALLNREVPDSCLKCSQSPHTSSVDQITQLTSLPSTTPRQLKPHISWITDNLMNWMRTEDCIYDLLQQQADRRVNYTSNNKFGYQTIIW